MTEAASLGLCGAAICCALIAARDNSNVYSWVLCLAVVYFVVLGFQLGWFLRGRRK